MKQVLEIIEKLRELSGNEQLEFLKQNSDNKLLREVLEYTYNPDKMYKINEAKLLKAFQGPFLKTDLKDGVLCEMDINIWDRYKKCLDELILKKGVKDSDISSLVREIFLPLCSNSLDLAKGILLKDLRLGLNIKTLNKVWKDFYFRYPYMGAKTFSMDNLKKVKMPCIGQLKADGLFCNAIVDPINQTVEYRSRQGKPLNIQGSLEESLLKIRANQKFVITGELLCLDKNNKPLPREISNGIIRRDNKTQDELDSIVLLCWDFVPYDNFVEGIWEVPYENRLGTLFRMTEMAGDRVRVIDTFSVNDIDGAMKLFNDLYSKGEEGIIVKENDLIWKDGKPKGCVKIKNESECDLQAVGFEEGSGAYTGMCGTINCVSADKQLVVGVKPRTPESAQEIWNNQDKYINQILTVKYNAKIKDKNKDTWSLFLPVFVEWRIGEKDIADKLDDIK